MMWTHGKSPKPEPLVDFRGVYAKYNRIVLIINSCMTHSQLNSCKNIVKNFKMWCIESKVNPRMYISLVKFLEEKIENKSYRIP
jgi:hypothetical protein